MNNNKTIKELSKTREEILNKKILDDIENISDIETIEYTIENMKEDLISRQNIYNKLLANGKESDMIEIKTNDLSIGISEISSNLCLLSKLLCDIETLRNKKCIERDIDGQCNSRGKFIKQETKYG